MNGRQTILVLSCRYLWYEYLNTAVTDYKVMDIIRQNYDSLVLKFIDKLDSFPIYSEEPGEMAFFVELFSTLISEYQKQYYLNDT